MMLFFARVREGDMAEPDADEDEDYVLVTKPKALDPSVVRCKP